MVTSEVRLPIDHPDYRYPSSRNPYWKKLHELKGLVYSDNETEEYRGKWRSTFANKPTTLHVEIGCNAGHVIVEWAARKAPAQAYVGIDWKFKMIFKAAEKAVKRKLDNLALFRAHAERIQFMFGPGEIDRLYLFFPDPWPKKSQWKFRYVTPERLETIAQLMRPDGIFHIKTDHKGYFEWMEKAIGEVSGSWKVMERTDDLYKDHPNPSQLDIPDVTLFERLFIKDGIKINSIKLRPRS